MESSALHIFYGPALLVLRDAAARGNFALCEKNSLLHFYTKIHGNFGCIQLSLYSYKELRTYTVRSG
jgi:hypothetical protein